MIRLIIVIAILSVLGFSSTLVFASEYLNFNQAMELAFTQGEKIERFRPQLSPDEQSAILKATQSTAKAKLGGIYIGHKDGKLSGTCFIDHVIGRTEFITFLCHINVNGDVQNVRVMTYREPIGGEVRHDRWIKLFDGKNLESPLRLNKDIPNIAGATLSSRAITERVRFFTRFYSMALKKHIEQYLNSSATSSQNIDKKAEEEEEIVNHSHLFHYSNTIGNSILQIQTLESENAKDIFTHAENFDRQYNSWEQKLSKNSLNDPFFKEASQLSLKTNGWFQPFIRPILTLWWNASTEQRWPTIAEQKFAQEKTKTYYQTWQKYKHNSSLDNLTQDFIKNFDLSALRKGAVLDYAAQKAPGHGLINYGQSIWLAYGTHTKEWDIELDQPFSQTIQLRSGQALAVSANNARWNIAGQDIGHLFNPHTGQPGKLNHHAAIISDSAAIADVLATVFCLADIDECQDIIQKFPGSRAILVRNGKTINFSAE